MEIFDVVDEEGNPTGETIERTRAHELGVRHRTAHIWVVRKYEGRTQVLLQKRAMNKDSFPGCYDTSAAGHIHAGDDPKTSAIRELSEELGVKAQDEDLIFADKFKVSYEKKFNGKLFKDNEIAFVYIYAKPVDISKLVIQKEELDSANWFDIEYVMNKIEPRDDAFCVPKGGFMIAKKWCEQSL